jgi:hypothetical protein
MVSGARRDEPIVASNNADVRSEPTAVRVTTISSRDRANFIIRRPGGGNSVQW